MAALTLTGGPVICSARPLRTTEAILRRMRSMSVKIDDGDRRCRTVSAVAGAGDSQAVDEQRRLAIEVQLPSRSQRTGSDGVAI